MKNPIFDELIKLKLISKLNLMTLSNKTRDKKIKVIKDLKTKIIFLEKYITINDYYSSLKYKDNDRKVSKKSKEPRTKKQTFHAREKEGRGGAKKKREIERGPGRSRVVQCCR